MKTGSRIWNILTGLIILGGWVVCIAIIASPGEETKIGFISLLLMFIINMIIAAGVGMGLIVMRLFKVCKAQLGIPYIVLGLLNIVSGSAGLVALSVTEFGQAAMLCATNLVVGIIIIADLCIRRKAVLKQ